MFSSPRWAAFEEVADIVCKAAVVGAVAANPIAFMHSGTTPFESPQAFAELAKCTTEGFYYGALAGSVLVIGTQALAKTRNAILRRAVRKKAKLATLKR